MCIKRNDQALKGILGLTIMMVAAVFIPTAAIAREAAGTTVAAFKSITRLTLDNGAVVDNVIINGPPAPPPGFEAQRRPVMLPKTSLGAGVASITVPAYRWVYGCSAVSAAMIAAYYDRTGFPNIYTGPANGGVMPLDDSLWPTWSDGPATYPGNPLVASKNGLDGRTSPGSIEDYWVQYYSDIVDPYISGGWTPHTWGDAIGDYMKTSQSAYDNSDGTTHFYTWSKSPAPFTCASMLTYNINTKDGTYGRKLFYEGRGYTVTDCYNQKTDNTISGGFSFSQYRAEIDAGRPVMLNLDGHTVVGIGYDSSANLVYLHDTWDNGTHTMTWGGSYAGMPLLTVSIVNIQSPVAGNTIIRVTPTGTSVWPCGSTWGSACELKTALTNAAQGDEIWVAAGVYKPTTSTDQTIYFEIKPELAVYGGFAGNETERTQRNPQTHITILSGDIDNNDSQSPVITEASTVTGNATNSYHVAVATGDNITLDGFTITGGYGYYGCPYGWNSQFGGGLYSMGTITINNVHFSGNHSFQGGGLFSAAPVSISNSVFTGNYADYGGGAYTEGGSTTLANTTFSNNRAAYDGGGLHSTNGPVITHTAFADNKAGTNGGGFYVNGSATLSDIVFDHNRGGNLGGGMTVGGVSPLTITRATFLNNYGPTSGGGLAAWDGNVVVSDSVFSGNSAWYGGALGIGNGGNWIVNNVSVVGNYAIGAAGGIDTASAMILTNATVAGNYTTESNSYGGGIVAHGTMEIRNSIVWGNHDAGMYGNLSHNICPGDFSGCSWPSITYSDVQFGWSGTGNINADPLLLPLGYYGGDIKTAGLQAGSPAIDAADDASCATSDARGVLRPQGAHCDMGAFEASFETVSGNAGVAAAVMSYTDVVPLTVTADENGDYVIPVATGWSGTVSPSKTGYLFSPVSRTYPDVQTAQTGQDYTAAPVPKYTISGNAGVAGAMLSYTDGSAKTATADGSGNYSFEVTSGWSGTVTPALTRYTFSPAGKTYENVTANLTNQNYTATITSYTISGYTWVAGTTLTYTDGITKTASTNNGSSYSFSVPAGWSGTVTPTVRDYVFPLGSRTYANVLSDQPNQNYSYATGVNIYGFAGWLLAGATVSFTDGVPKSYKADSIGEYVITVAPGWTGTITPALTGYTFSPTSITINNASGTEIRGINFTAATAATYTISGNAGVAGATLNYTEGSVKAATTDSNGNYSFIVTTGWSGTVTPSKTGYTFSPANRTYSNVVANQTVQNYTPTVMTTYTISGNAGIAGVTLSYTDGSPKTAVSDSSGNYAFSVSPGWSGTVMPLMPGYAFAPASVVYTNVLANQTNQNYSAGTTYTISGNAGIPGAMLSYTDNSARTATADGSGNYVLAVSVGWSGTVTPYRAGYTFSPPDRAYINVIASQTGQNYTPTLVTCSISGNTGVAGATVSYTDGSAKTATADESGNYTIVVTYNWSGTVTPSKTGYSFAAVNRVYTHVIADQTNQDYAATPVTYTISGNAGIAGAILSYTDGSAKTAASDGSGNYSFPVSYNWSGTVTPAKAAYTFSPSDRAYTNALANQTEQNYTASLNALDRIVLSPAEASVSAGGSQSFTAEGFDQYNSSLGDVTALTQFLIAPDGSCTGGSCTASISGLHTVTGTSGGKTSEASLLVNPGTAAMLLVTAPGTAIGGNPFNATVTATDAYSNTVPGYSGTVHFSSGDLLATVPSDSMLVNGTGTFPVTFRTAGLQSIVAADTAASSITGNTAVSVSLLTALGSIFSGSGSVICVPAAFLYGESFSCSVCPEKGYDLSLLSDNTEDRTSACTDEGRCYSYLVAGATQNHDVKATFRNFPVLILQGENVDIFSTIQSAADAATHSSDRIQVQAGIYTEAVIFDHAAGAASLEGGYDSGFSSVTGITVISGTLTISNGTLVVHEIAVK